MIRVHISPDFIDSSETGGIRRVVEAMLKYFPYYGIEHTRNVSEAHIIINHGAMQTSYKSTPIINVNHGLYWSRQPWEDGYQEVNEKVVESMEMAVAHTAPSEWVSRAIRRGGLFYPRAIYHGVDYEEFSPGENGRYVLWNKARADYVSDPRDVMNVASKLPDIQFWTTIGKTTSNVKVLMEKPGKAVPYGEMKRIVTRAGVYLCTARETFGIGTLEALAAGVPVAGWDWGGQKEIIQQGQTGYLAPPGDFKALAECIQLCIDERDRLSANAIEDARANWRWEPRIAQYVELIEGVYREYYELHRPKVSVIVTAYNLDRYLPKCLESVSAQNFDDYECLVIDDAGQVSTKAIVEKCARSNRRIRYLATPRNLGLPDARNFGFQHAHGRYIRHLDADDYLADEALALEAEALDEDPGIHIVYGHLEVVREDGTRIYEKSGSVARSGWPEEQFNWFKQMAHLNQIPSCSMMRREVLERSGGYRGRMKRAEDAEFWCRVTSLGFRAKKITQAVTYFHRQRGDSKGAQEWKQEGKEPDWTAWFPWRMGAGDYGEGNKTMRKYGNSHPTPPLVPFGAQGKASGRRFWYVHDYSYPIVSVIVTCGPYHEQHLLDALDSVQGQTYPDWECIVVNDTGKKWDPDIPGAPFARVVDMDGNQGTAAARNKGYEYARGHFVVWLDADDIWLPWFLERMVAYAENNDGVIYCDLIQDRKDKLEVYRYQEFDESVVPRNMMYPGSSVLLPRKITEKIKELQGGWDCKIPGMEDWDYQVAVHDAGFCAYRIPEALFVYRVYSSTKRESDYAKIGKIKDYMDRKWRKYRLDGEKMGCGCGKKVIVKTKPASTLKSSGNFANIPEIFDETTNEQMVNMEYLGPLEQTFSVRSRAVPGVTYRFGNNTHHKMRTVFLRDAQYLVGQVDKNNQPTFRIVSGATMENRDPQAVLGRTLAG
jgi:glycosyltransferase involved in cell wall biosynthesis